MGGSAHHSDQAADRHHRAHRRQGSGTSSRGSQSKPPTPPLDTVNYEEAGPLGWMLTTNYLSTGTTPTAVPHGGELAAAAAAAGSAAEQASVSMQM